MHSIKPFLDELRYYCTSGGPQPNEYHHLDEIFFKIWKVAGAQPCPLKEEFFAQSSGAFNSTATMQGHAVLKPNGYSGDFAIIERIYELTHATEPHLRRWDAYFHSGSAARAVRSRKEFAVRQFQKAANDYVTGCRMLNVASGPCTDVAEFMANAPDAVLMKCIDVDPRAVSYGQTKLLDWSNKVEVLEQNAFRIRETDAYDLVWSAGLFDYLSDKLFVLLLRRLLRSVRGGGRVIVGNFGPENTQRYYMEFGGWVLHHRTPEQLLQLARIAGVSEQYAAVETEDTGVNHFLCINLVEEFAR